MFSGTDSPFLMLSAVFHLPLLPVLHLPVNSLSGRELSCSHRTVWLSVVLFYFFVEMVRAGILLGWRLGGTPPKWPGMHAFLFPTEEWRLSTLEATKCY